MNAMILFTYLTLFVLGLADNIRGPMFSSVLELFQVNQTYGSLFFSIASFFAWLCGLSASFLIHKIGAFRSLVLALLMMMIGTLIMGFIRTDFSYFLIGAGVFGASVGIMGVSQNVLVMVNAPAAQLSKYQSGLHAMYGIASLLAPFVVATLVDAHYSFQISFYISALCCLVLVICSFWLKGKPGSTVNKDDDPTAEQHMETRTHRRFWYELMLYSLMVACYVGLELSLSTRSSLYFEKELLFSKEQAMRSASWFFMALAFGRALAFFIPVKMTVRKQMLILMITSIVVFSIAVLLKAQWIFLAGFFMAPLYPLSMSYGAQLFQRKLALMTSMAVSLSSVAVVVMHSLMGWVGDHYGVAASLWVGIVFGILSLCALWILPHTDSDNKAKITNSENTVAAGAGAAT